jgi:RsiW-degrading membrane proteinase PrsW (M82 family)
MGTGGHAWLAACVALSAAWILGASWQSEHGTLTTALRGALGGLAAFGIALIGYGLLQIGGVELRWELVAHGAWPALGFAALVGLIEETAKLGGILLATPAVLPIGRPRTVLRTTAAVAAVFAIAEATLAARGATWSVALGRAAFGPVAHAVLAAPFAVALAEAAGSPRSRVAVRLAVSLVLAALLHGLGDWSVAQPGWGRVGFAAALLAPTFWLYAHCRIRAAAAVRAAGPRGEGRLSPSS